ncbi:MAG: orotidine-5'-phosphate decarboxylase [Parvibaculaceae bacterium]
MPSAANPLCIALDTPDIARARELVRALKGAVGMVKVGMEFFYAHGAAGYAAVAGENLPVFLDLKLHDIPNTVASALSALMRLEPLPAIVNVHATGGPMMLEAAARTVDGRAKLIAVTVLTSLSDADLAAAGFAPGRDLPVALARLAQGQGLDGVVCSPRDVAAIRAACGPSFLTVVPGIRPAGIEHGDQKRVSTPAEALAAGADILVVGRPVTGATDPAAAARAILSSLPAAA